MLFLHILAMMMSIFVWAGSVNGLPEPKYDGTSYNANAFCDACGTINWIKPKFNVCYAYSVVLYYVEIISQ